MLCRQRLGRVPLRASSASGQMKLSFVGAFSQLYNFGPPGYELSVTSTSGSGINGASFTASRLSPIKCLL
eukprot:scaffold2850_cov235-Pinguiococcus_pyrenoidosus.AAC.5